MKKLFILLMASVFVSGVFVSGVSTANVNSYAFASNPGNYTTYSGGTLLGTTSNNEQVFNANTSGVPPPATGPGFPIGFVFNYNGNDYDKFAVSTNGWIVLGRATFTIGSTVGNSTPISTVGPVGFANAISSLGMDLQGQTGSELTFLNDGIAPYRVLIIQWKGYRYQTSTGDNFNFQIKIYETTNEVQFVYGSFLKSIGPSYAQVGIRGDDNSDFHNRTTTSSWASTMQGIINTSTCLLSPAVKPSTGLTYTFTPVYDFTDAPSPYPTLMASNGARHTNTGLKLGNLIDTEINGFPDPAAMGDDNNNLDDEDGVWWSCNFVPGQTNTIQVTASGTGLLNAWFDFNANGSWAQLGEQVFTNTALVAGINYLSVPVPLTAMLGPTFARFRFSTYANLSYTGLANNGEVEDYQFFIEPPLPMDYGDAPDPTYPTLAASNGARHAQDGQVFLGNIVDYEVDGQPNALAEGDIPDEDGVVFNTTMIPGLAATITVTASVGGGLFQGWIDFNLDGDWSDAGEQIFTNTLLMAGPQPLNFNIPLNATQGKTYARFRYSTMPNLLENGCAPNGEVEDYMTYIGEYDLGDAPDPSYPTLLASNGAIHKITGLLMGVLIDAEPNGQPDAIATGDDINPPGANDEDGVWWPCNFVPGQVNTVKVTANGPGTLNAWFDFNQDGDWADLGEQVFTNVILAAGTADLFVTVPGNAAPGTTFARFRFSSLVNLTYTGYAPDGEVEDYSIIIQPEEIMDYGDAPAPYPTLSASNGARHSQVQGSAPIFLGNQIDWEINGQPNANATGDDLNNLQDEDGIVFNTPLNPGLPATITVTASIGGAAFQGWIDFNADGDWADAGEQIFTNVILIAGPQPLTFNIPANAVTGSTFARFRFSTMGNLSFYGCAPNGEVEDYKVAIVIPQPDLDYGDAPDPTYPTLLAGNGARHVNTGLNLGNLIDMEPDGQPNATATGDDNNPAGSDDEDGVWWPCNFVPGHKSTIQVTASGAGILNAWFDFTRDGDWADAGEQVFTNVVLVPGLNSLSIIVPVNASVGNSFARFRLSTQQNLSYTGLANDGEVEDYLVIIDAAGPMDYGDAPDPLYPTLAASNGARHAQGAVGIFLGNLVDYELDGQPNAFAAGDVPDEDGVKFNTPLIPGVAAASITVTASVGGGAFQGWIDFNQDGDWTDAGEQIFTNTVLVAGAQVLNFNVPLNALTGKTYARFRYSTTANLTSTGCAPNGEVEDYMLYVGEYDLGDAPDPTYPALLVSNGAIHKKTALFMGVRIDAEPNGQPNASATGDDINPPGLNDEDGVWWPCNFVPGYVNTVKVTTSGPGYLNVWFDYNMDGDWADPGEQVFTNVLLLAGTTDLFVTVPANASTGTAFARFRFSSLQNISYTGYAPDGEVEDYSIIIQAPEEMDYGDVPDPTYPTLASSNGARHANNIGSVPVFLGNLIDWEINGQPNALANGDDNNNLPDEDGVLMNVPMIPGQGATILVTASIGGGALQAWIDFNADGDWDDPGEQIFANVFLVAGQQPLTFNIPGNAIIGHTYARFRYSTMGNLMPYGCAPNGEVEDYRVYVGPLDFGDAPDPTYPTLLVNNGARHHIDWATYLGAAVDPESDGIQSINATGDDLNNFDDEDGVTFLWPVAASNPCKLKVVASVGNALLSAWIDFNRNGSWADPGEQIFVDKNLVAGNNFPTFIAPANVVPGPTMARFRFSHQPGLSYDGYAIDGEVEDYAVNISDFGDIKWQQSFETSLPGLHSDQAGWIADDWICAGGMVTDLHWWGNYEIDGQGQEQRGAGIDHFLIKIYSDANCLPGMIMQTYIVPFSSITEVNTGYINSEMCPIYYYEYVLNQPFLQTPGTIYWVSIQAISTNPAPPFNACWRWQESNRWFQSISCGAASYAPGSQWITIFWDYPLPGQYSDMAFIITSQIQQFDYGDAPDPTYPTLLLSNGARHMNTGLKLGNLIDVEMNGLPNATATGDDNNNLDDEDGILWQCNFVPGQTTTLQVTASGAGFLNAWFDFDQNGSWADAGEQIFTNMALSPGVNYLPVFVPFNSAVGPAFARFRLSTQQNLSFTGLAQDGEVEDYQLMIEDAGPMDYGDAPDPTYPTLAASNGARHAMGPPAGIFLGNQVDYELNGQPNATAAGDVPDEDGVIFNTQLIPGLPASVTVIASVGGGALQGWIDFNQDGDWTDAGEQVFFNAILVAGVQVLNFNVPMNIPTGKTYARFRYSTIGALSPTGCAPNGEVEDYMIYIGDFDLGDAPDPGYPTLLASDGAIHQITPLFMGIRIDGEPNGQPNGNATGDDINPAGFNDEDGVWWPCNFVPGQVNTVKVTTSGPGFLSAWFDFNIDGDWSDAGEQVFTDVLLSGGTEDLFVNVPANASPGVTFTRFRFSSLNNLTCTGFAPDGEVEDYSITIQTEEPMDYGDAPDPTYPTLASSNGARHIHDPLFNPIWLGNLIDWELNGQPNVNANGDDLMNLPDEDGVVLNTPLLPGMPAMMTVVASLGGAAFQGWIDFDQDGDWMDPGEQIFNNTILVAGPQMLNFIVPPNALPGYTYARFRYSTMANLAPYGCAPNGEVEDYKVFVGPPDEFDLGDAPDPYPTLLLQNGASHKIANGTYLGSLIDSEPDGQPSALANGDDLTGLDDEDGVVFMWPLAAGNPCKLKVTASVGDALLNCWIDFNRNGSWAEPNEHVFVDLNILAGDNYLTFIAPQNAKTGATIARFRFSHQPALYYTGQAFDGEVEDYAVSTVEYSDLKWHQPPDTLLPGLHVNETTIIADEWICHGGVVTDLHWWGNYEMWPAGGEKRGAGINHFLVNIYTNSNCLPNSVVRSYVVPFPAEIYTGLINNEGSYIYRYDFTLPELFIQTKDTTYWMSVQAMANNPQNPPSWRWQEANRWLFPIHCGAASNLGPVWQTITWPFFELVKYSDMAFQVTSWVVDSLALQNINVASGQDLCYDASNVLYVAGNGTTFTVQNGARVTMIAGQKIRYMPGTTVFPGGYMHGYITTTGQYCNSLNDSLVIGPLAVPDERQTPENATRGSNFNIYPNPTTGKFLIELTGDTGVQNLKIEIYTMLGERVLSRQLTGQTRYDLSLENQQPGVYILHLISGQKVETVKVIKQ